MDDRRVPTQFLDLTSQDFGPKQEDPGARIQSVGRPPPTVLIQTHPERVRKDADVIAELDQTQNTFVELSRRWVKQAKTIWVATWDSAVRAVHGAFSNGRSAGRMITLPQDVSLRVRAEEDAPAALTMHSGLNIVIYPEIDAPAGWIAARAPSGELGYVAAEQVVS